jgi:hypothetical protein
VLVGAEDWESGSKVLRRASLAPARVGCSLLSWHLWMSSRCEAELRVQEGLGLYR